MNENRDALSILATDARGSSAPRPAARGLNAWSRPVAGLVMLALTSSIAAAEPVDYEKQIKPLLSQRCVSCHGPLRQEGGLRVDAAALMKKGGDSGPALVVNDVAKSLLIDAVTGGKGFEGESRMPMEAAPLTAEEISLLKSWIAAGAKSPVDEKVTAGPADHWSFKVPVRPPVPQPKNLGWVRNPIDAFLAVEQEKRGLTPGREAPKSVLLRRLSLDLIGLPPTPEELRDFLADNSPEAYDKAVNRLLESPLHGERWGRHWMDVWRYSDWYGYGSELRNSSRHIWRWRDWIVDSLNADKPYDQMILEMLAADELSPGNQDSLRATGFLTRQYFKFNRNVWLENTIEHTSKAFLGVTMNCARCHDHKYDPVSQQQFYEMRAIFEPYQVRTDRLGDANLEKEGLDLAYDATLSTETFVFDRGNEALPLKDKPMKPAVPAILGHSPFAVSPVSLPVAQWYPASRPEVQTALLSEVEAKVAVAAADVQKADAALAAARKTLDDVKTSIAGIIAFAEIPGETTVEPKPAALLADDFAAANDKLWTRGAGDWVYADRRLVQKNPAAAFQFLTSKDAFPQDLVVEMKYRTTGGGQYKSVGVIFDQANDETFHAVYSSVGGGKLQAMTSRNGAKAYPPAGTKPHAFVLNQETTLRLELRDTLLNVSVDGQFVLAYRLPDRQEGKISIWTYDATAEFRSIRVERLSPDATLKEPDAAAPASPAPAVTLAGAMAALTDAEFQHRLAVLRAEIAVKARDSVNARVAADRAKYAVPPTGDASELAKKAVTAQRSEAAKTASLALAQAEFDEMKAGREALMNPAKAKLLTDAKRKTETARKASDAAVAAQSAAADENYMPLGPVYPKESTGRRLALARWIADRQNPLTARVAVNQIWMRHFGQPLVPTVFDFGLNGKPPTHPELLDWLACELVEGGSRETGNGNREQHTAKTSGAWRMKHIHRLMVTSNAYRRDSVSGQDAAASPPADPDNVWYTRMNSRRMEAEIVRDSVLAIAGNLDRKTGGPELDEKLGLTTFRRSLYYRHAPEKFMTFLEVFDAANTTECYRRIETVVPQQALALVNSQLAIEQSRLFAAKLSNTPASSSPDPGRTSDAAFIESVFEQILCRPPTSQEAAACQKFLSDQSVKLADSKSLTAFSTGAAMSVKASPDPKQRARENLVHVLFNHTEFVTIR